VSGRLDLAGRTVFLTGPARGIGAETALQLSRRGAKVALAGLEPACLRVLAERIGSDRAAWFEADVREWDSLEKAVAGAVERFGRVDVVVANAGIAPVGLVASIDRQDFERTIDVNLLGVWRTVRLALPHVTERRGHVLAIASMAAAVHLPLMSAYAAAKAGVSALADALRMELQGTGTTVGCAYFGFIDTDMTRTALAEADGRAAERRAGRLFRPHPLPVSRAGRAIVRGIEHRTRWIVLPRTHRLALYASAPFQRLAEAGARRLGVAEELRRRPDPAGESADE
jgi:NAD(P)-dependent dehydrogenase (short-subunit alcohol dehydrogenase family)